MKLLEDGYEPEDVIVLYRGQGELHNKILSSAARKGGIEYSQEMLDKLPKMDPAITGLAPEAFEGEPFKRALAIHTSEAYWRIDSPFIAMTTKTTVARGAAERAAGSRGLILEIVIPRSKVFDVEGLLGRGAYAEYEFVTLHELPDQYITSHWGVMWRPGDPITQPAYWPR